MCYNGKNGRLLSFCWLNAGGVGKLQEGFICIKLTHNLQQLAQEAKLLPSNQSRSQITPIAVGPQGLELN
jgi:hypothetical protein